MTVDLSYLDEQDPIDKIQEEKAKNFDPLPDGKYTVEVVGAEMTESKAGQPMLHWSLKVIAGPYADRMMWRNSMLASEANRKWTKGDLLKCEMSLAKWSDLPTRASELVGLVLAVTQKTANNYANCYIDRLLTQAEVDAMPTSEAAVAADKNDTCPF
jgi:hypothetical protein